MHAYMVKAALVNFRLATQLHVNIRVIVLSYIGLRSPLEVYRSLKVS